MNSSSLEDPPAKHRKTEAVTTTEVEGKARDGGKARSISGGKDTRSQGKGKGKAAESAASATEKDAPSKGKETSPKQRGKDGSKGHKDGSHGIKSGKDASGEKRGRGKVAAAASMPVEVVLERRAARAVAEDCLRQLVDGARCPMPGCESEGMCGCW